MKKANEQRCKKGFTLLEMLVVVLIIGILAGIALPQYQMAVTKAKVAAILPMMRHIKDSYMAWKLTKGSYCKDEECNEGIATITDLGIDCPDGWACSEYGDMENDTWDCFPNEEGFGEVYCINNNMQFIIEMYQLDDINSPEYAGMMVCGATADTIGEKVCKTLGGKLLDGSIGYYDVVYKLN